MPYDAASASAAESTAPHFAYGLCSPAPGKDHDRYLVGKSFAGVADGATPLDPSWPADVGEFSMFALDELQRHSLNHEASLSHVWRRALMDVRRQYGEVAPYLSCGVAMVRVRDCNLEFGTLGDCGAIVRRRDGSLISLCDMTLPRLDASVIITSDSEMTRRQLLANRRKMNAPEGYWIFADTPEAADHLQCAAVSKDNVSEFMLYTDGFFRLVDPYAYVESTVDLLDLVLSEGPKHALSVLRSLEENSGKSDCLLTRPDDATVVLGGPGVRNADHKA